MAALALPRLLDGTVKLHHRKMAARIPATASNTDRNPSPQLLWI